jgi:hypothetical protein
MYHRTFNRKILGIVSVSVKLVLLALIATGQPP